jgi:hypothetical protein
MRVEHGWRAAAFASFVFGLFELALSVIALLELWPVGER